MKNALAVKLIIIISLVILLQIPSFFVVDLISDREQNRDVAITSVGASWGVKQTLTGPYLTIPYNKYIKYNSNGLAEFKRTTQYLHLLPEELSFSGSLDPKSKKRGIYEVILYESDLNIKGDFNFSELASLGIDSSDIHWDQIDVNLGITDLKGLKNQASIEWGKQSFLFGSGLSNEDLGFRGIHTRVNKKDTEKVSFSIDLDLRGSQSLEFYPLGKETHVSLSSSWNTPSFFGNFLPDSSHITEAGFSADWSIVHLNRNYPQAWTGNKFTLQESEFGLNLFMPVDKYKKAHRVGRYELLFVGLTFLVFFFVEVLNKVSIHPLQYILVGIALILFYTLLLSFSEYIGFNLAYILAALMTLVLVSLFASAITKSKKIGLFIFSILVLLYGFIFVIIQLEDYALLVGSLGLFAILCVVMYFSKKIDWYQIGEKSLMK